MPQQRQEVLSDRMNLSRHRKLFFEQKKVIEVLSLYFGVFLALLAVSVKELM